MDPNACLRELRETVKAAFSAYHHIQDDESVMADRLVELAEKFDGLDHWLTSGGFLPKDWEKRK